MRYSYLFMGISLLGASFFPSALWSWDGEYQVVQQDPIAKFPKWTGILSSVETELGQKADIQAPFTGGWDEFIAKTKSADRLSMIKKTNEIFNGRRSARNSLFCSGRKGENPTGLADPDGVGGGDKGGGDRGVVGISI